uniref:CHK domain-containing protein n=1 Tax=Parastrongyloides trichosuri TaxID=131310 RepID=A0A0N4ZAM1_PARTI
MFVDEGYGKLSVENSKVSIGWVFDCLEKNCDSFKKAKGDYKVLKLETRDISDGKGYLSKVYISTVHFDGDESKTYQFIIKIPGLESIDKLHDEQPDAIEIDEVINCETVCKFHNQEWMFYTKTAKEIVGLKAPSCYGGCEAVPNEKDGCLVMKFLSPTSANIPFFQTFNIYQAKSVLNEIMKLQVFSLTDGKHWKSKYTSMFTRKLLASMTQSINTGFRFFEEFCPKEMFDEVEDDFKILISKYEDIGSYAVENLIDSSGKNSVLCHGDLWSNNIMFELDSEKRFTNNVEAIIDWQTVFEGSVGSDIARFIVLGCSPEVRREIEVSYFPVYFKELKKKVMDKGGIFDMTFEEFVNAYDFCMIDQSFHTILMMWLNLHKVENSSDEDAYLWEARKFSLAFKVYFALKDAFKRVRKVKPEWLKN